MNNEHTTARHHKLGRIAVLLFVAVTARRAPDHIGDADQRPANSRAYLTYGALLPSGQLPPFSLAGTQARSLSMPRSAVRAYLQQ
ncbi:MAG TPA: hypothetical protein VF951_01400 [Streptosporangiaceae bacterium]